MTTPDCPGGSQAKPGSELVFVLGGTALVAFISNFAPPLAPFVSIGTSIVLDADFFCTTPRPELPEWSALDIAQLANGMSIGKLQQTVHHYMWNELCECIGSATPPPDIFVPPAELPVAQPWPIQPCDSAAGSSGVVNGPTVPVIPPENASSPESHHQLPRGTSRTARIYSRIDRLASPTDTFQRILAFRLVRADASNAGLHHLLWTPPDLDQELLVPVPNDAVGYELAFEWTTGSLTPVGSEHSATVDIYCDGATPGGLQEKCCPPDPSIIARLDRMSLDLALIIARLGPTVPLEEISVTPIADEGSVPLVLGVRQVLIELTTLGATVALVPYANPDRTMRAGTVRFGNDFGWQRRLHVDNTTNLFQVPVDSQVVSWSLSPGTLGRLVQLGQPL